ncbi:MAG: DUF3540 domain-containing protein, partial [Myxococcales bacterium]|nr:DUF3540 domain-containing protein [Myxococcales bacterium]
MSMQPESQAKSETAQPSSPSSVKGRPVGLSQRLARVRAITDGEIFVDEDGRSRLVQQATSCLLEPQVGDLVLIVGSDDDPGGWILAVLERPQPRDGEAVAEAVLAAPAGAGLTLKASGRVRVEGSAGVDIVTPAAL